MSIIGKMFVLLFPFSCIFSQEIFQRIDRNFNLGNKWVFEAQVFWPNSEDSLAKPRIYREYVLTIEIVDTSRDEEGRKIYSIKYDPDLLLPDGWNPKIKEYQKDSIRVGIISKEYENGQSISVDYLKLNSKGERLEFAPHVFGSIERKREYFPPFWVTYSVMHSDYHDWFPKTWLGEPQESLQSFSSNHNVSHCEVSEVQLGDTLVRKLEYYPSKGSDWHSTVTQKFTKDSPWWVSYEQTPQESKVPVMHFTLIESYINQSKD